MELSIVGTGSSGNCYILQHGKDVLIIEAGMPLLEAKKALHFELANIQAVLISHSHGDHSRYVKEYLKAGFKVCMSCQTAEELKLNHPNVLHLKPNKVYNFNSFNVVPFSIVHDVPCLGFHINHDIEGNIVFVTDTAKIPFKFKDINNWMIECNHSEAIIEKNYVEGKIGLDLIKRIRNNHISLEYLCDYFRQTDTSYVNKIILLHGSDSNSSISQFKEKIMQSTGKDVYIAKRHLKLTLNKKL